MSDGVIVEDAPVRSVAGIAVFAGQAGLPEALRAAFWVSLPAAAGFVENGAVRLCRLGPSRFLVSGEPGADLPRRMMRLLEGVAAVTDQSDLWIGFVVSGTLAREVLSRVVPVDLHPVKFGVGALASTRAGHLDVRVFRTGEMRFEIAVARSFAEDLRHLLNLAAHR